jgi:hypothetical protein
MLGHPNAAVAKAFGMLRKCASLIEGGAAIRSLAHTPEFENGKWDHEVT